MGPGDSRLRIGASSWSAPSWEGVFYPPGAPPSDYLAHYASRFDTVEVDATFYRIPDERTVDAWRDRTPPGFVFAAKFPQVITHEKLLEGCAEECLAFVRVMDRLGDKLGPLLLQFRYFRKEEFRDPNPFIDRLERFLPSLPRDRRYAVEVRNKTFVTARLLDVLRRNRAALALIDHPWFFGVDQVMMKGNVLTADFAYVRLRREDDPSGEWAERTRMLLNQLTGRPVRSSRPLSGNALYVGVSKLFLLLEALGTESTAPTQQPRATENQD